MPVTFSLIGSNDDPEKYIRVYWTYSNAEVRTTIGVKILSKYWYKGNVKAKSTTIVNTKGDPAGYIAAFLSALRARCEYFEDSGREVDIMALQEEFRSILSFVKMDFSSKEEVKRKDRQYYLLTAFSSFMEEEKIHRDWTESTLIQYKKTERLLKEFSSNINLKRVTINWMEQFFAFLNTKLGERTVDTMMINFRSFLRWVNKKYGINTGALRYTYKTHLNIKDIVYLSSEELKRLRDLIIPNDDKLKKDVLEDCRYMFLFCCMTGLRFSDMQRLQWVHVFKDSIRMFTKKTMKHVEIALNPISKDIIKRYEEKCTEDSNEGYVFPRISNGELNQHLKTLGQLLNLDEKVSSAIYKNGKRTQIVKTKAESLTTHSGRHTFAVQALSADIPGSVVMAWTGHSNYKSLKPYIELTSNAKDEAMKIFEEYMATIFKGSEFDLTFPS